MRVRAIYLSLLAVLLVLAVAVTACGGTGNSVEPTQNNRPTATRRSTAPTRAATDSAKPTQDALDDSVDNSTPEDPNATPDVLDDSANNSDTETPPGPQVQDGRVVLKNTAWLLAGGERIYQFCENGQWQVIQGGDNVEKRGTFQAEGNTLNLKNTADSQESKYTMTWQAKQNILELKEGNATLKLEYDGAADCK